MNKLISRAAKVAMIASLSGFAAGNIAAAQTKTMYVAGGGGSFEKMMREVIIPPFEAANNVKIEYITGVTTETLARLQAQRSAQEIDIALLSDGPHYQAIDFGFCTKIEDSKEVEALHPVARLQGSDGKGVSYALNSTVIVYNEAVFKERNLPVPTSWADLENESYKGLLAISGLGTSLGVQALVMVARAEGGSEKNIEPGFKAFSEKIRPNILTFATAPKIEEMLQNGEIAIAVLTPVRANNLRKRGLPIAIADLKEGNVAALETVCTVVDSDVPDLAQAFARHILTDSVQQVFAANGYLPGSSQVTLNEELQKSVDAFGDVDKLVQIDWATINAVRPEWTRRWNREVEQ